MAAMRVLFATPERGAEGAGLVTALQRAGVDVEVVVPDEPGRSPLGGEARRPLDVPPWAAPAFVRGIDHAVAGQVHLISTPRAARSFAFARAVAALVQRQQPAVVHIDGWFAGTLLAALTRPPPSVVSLGDVADQGVTDGSWLARLGPRGRHYEWFGGTNPLAGAVALADAVVAASPSHATEVLTPAFGHGLDGPLRHRWADLLGIRAGIDTARWDPAVDAHLAAPYGSGAAGVEGAKAANRRVVLARCGWPDDGTPLAIALSPLTERKGADLLAPIVPVLTQVPIRLLVHGAGDPATARTLAALAADHGATFAFVEGHDEQLRHLGIAGADLLVMPSRDEPCGTEQMVAMRYGTIPVVTAVGGLLDTVADADWSDDGTGFVADRVDSIALVVGAVPGRPPARRPPTQARPRAADHGPRLVVGRAGGRPRRRLRTHRRHDTARRGVIHQPIWARSGSVIVSVTELPRRPGRSVTER